MSEVSWGSVVSDWTRGGRGVGWARDGMEKGFRVVASGTE